MPQEIEGSEFAGIKRAGKLPEVLQSLQFQLERIRQEQWAKNRSWLQGLATEQQQCLERLTQAIVGKIFGEVASEWETSVAAGHGSQIATILSRLWGSRETNAWQFGDEPWVTEVRPRVAARPGISQRVSQKCFGQTHQQGANLQTNVMVSHNLLVADEERTVTQKCGTMQPNRVWVKRRKIGPVNTLGSFTAIEMG